MGVYSFNTLHDRPCMEAQWIGTLRMIQKARQSQSNLVTGQEQKALCDSQMALKRSYGYKTFCSSSNKT